MGKINFSCNQARPMVVKHTKHDDSNCDNDDSNSRSSENDDDDDDKLLVIKCSITQKHNL